MIALDRYVAAGSNGYSTEYKSYLVDREAGLFGFGVWRNDRVDYLLLKLEGGNLLLCHVLSFAPRDATYYAMSNIRAAYIDDCLYVFVDGAFAVRSLAEPQA